MYFFVPYNISEIQKGIQAGHVALEYAYDYGRTEEFQSFVKNDKTWIILNGGTTCSRNLALENSHDAGTLNQIVSSLVEHYIPHSVFYEPDLNYALTAVCFLADERVWDREKYVDARKYIYGIYNDKTFEEQAKDISDNIFFSLCEKDYSKWLKEIGGKKNAFLRELIKDKRLA